MSLYLLSGHVFTDTPDRIAGQENVGGAAFYSIFVTSFDLQKLVPYLGFSLNIMPTRLELQPQRQNTAWSCHDDQQEVVCE
jgi:hypothetical protein